MLDKHFPLYALSFFSTLILTAVIEKKIIPRLAAKARQPIYEEGPRWHMSKSGTPTMGGLAFLLACSVALIFSAVFVIFNISSDIALSVLISIGYAVSNSAIGIIDDLKKLKHKKNAGLSPTQKLILQFLTASLFLFARRHALGDTTEISFSFGSIDIGFLYYPLSLLLLVGIVNCANLTDGIDGLASSVAFAIGISFFYISAALNVEASLIASSVVGASVGFLMFNLHPAKIFMGDTGSLFFGALVSSCAFALKNPLLIVFIGGVYVLEGVSVILQVIYFKITKKRIFRMAPIHHHFEKSGWSENRICIAAILITFIFSIPAYIFYLP